MNFTYNELAASKNSKKLEPILTWIRKRFESYSLNPKEYAKYTLNYQDTLGDLAKEDNFECAMLLIKELGPIVEEPFYNLPTTIGKSVFVAGDLIVDTPLEVKGHLIVTGDVSADQNIDVKKHAYFHGNLTSSEFVSVGKTLRIRGNSIIEKDCKAKKLFASGSLCIEGSLYVKKYASTYDLEVKHDLQVLGALDACEIRVGKNLYVGQELTAETVKIEDGRLDILGGTNASILTKRNFAISLAPIYTGKYMDYGSTVSIDVERKAIEADAEPSKKENDEAPLDAGHTGI